MRVTHKTHMPRAHETNDKCFARNTHAVIAAPHCQQLCYAGCHCHRARVVRRRNDQSHAYSVMGRCYNEMFDSKNAEKAFFNSASEAPNTREPWFELAALMYRQQRWHECFAYSMRCLSIKDRLMVYTVDPEVWGFQIHDYAAISAYHLGLKDIALEHGKIALEMNPNDLRLQGNLVYYAGGGNGNADVEAT